MELFETKKNFILVNGPVALFCDRLSGHLSFDGAEKVSNEWNPVCLGQVKGLIGKIKFFPDGDSKLMLISKLEKVGDLPFLGSTYKITKVSTLSLSSSPVANLEIDLCKNHHFGIKKTERITTSPDGHKPLLRSFHDQVKKTAESVKPKSKDIRDREKFEKRMLEEYDKMFQEGGDCFYVSMPSSCASSDSTSSNCDITSSVLRQKRPHYRSSEPLWRRADDRYFWNRTMLQEAIDSAEQMLLQRFGRSVLTSTVERDQLGNSDYKNGDCNGGSSSGAGGRATAAVIVRHLEQLLMPIIQGYTDVQPFQLQVPGLSPIRRNLPNLPQNDTRHEYAVAIALISRRNRHRAGTRYRRRGVDPEGNVANYIETEQILKVDNDRSPHVVSFVQIRGSVPVFWSQTSLKYRPPIILEKTAQENESACQRHLEAELALYDRVVIVNLVDTSIDRAERKIADAFLEQLVRFNCTRITCVMFDFHDYCKGLQFDNVSILIKGITEIFRDMKYTWVDKNGLICEQKSIFRVNCVDCLDRTNVVQCMMAGVVVETQMRKLGLLSPEESLPPEFFQIMQTMWANNGDAISRQYSGTAAMKGDFTRTGTRTMNGLMKDGVSSVNRYYLRLREMNRQAAIDLMTGNDNSTEIVSLRSGRSDTEQKLIKQKEANIKELASQCKKACLVNEEECLTESILIMCNEIDSLDILNSWNEKDFQDMNTVALVTSKMLYFVSNLLLLPETRIDFQQKRQPLAIALPLKLIRKIQIGYDSVLFRSRQPMIRVFYANDAKPAITPPGASFTTGTSGHLEPTNDHQSSLFLAFKQPSLRLFNNMLVEVKKTEDQQESLRAIAESFYIAALSTNPAVVFEESLGKFERTRSEPVPAELVLPININMLYESVRLVSALGGLEDEDIDEDNLDPLLDDGSGPEDHLQPRVPGPAGGEGAANSHVAVSSNIETIKQGFRNVKDKMKIREWKDRLTTSVKTSAPLMKLKRLDAVEMPAQKQEDQQQEPGAPQQVQLITAGADVKPNLANVMPSCSSDNLTTASGSSSRTRLQRCRLGSTSDDEANRRAGPATAAARRASKSHDTGGLSKAKSDLIDYEKSYFETNYSFNSSEEDLKLKCRLENNQLHPSKKTVMKTRLAQLDPRNVLKQMMTKNKPSNAVASNNKKQEIDSDMEEEDDDEDEEDLPVYGPCAAVVHKPILTADIGSTKYKSICTVKRQLSVDKLNKERKIGVNKVPNNKLGHGRTHRDMFLANCGLLLPGYVRSKSPVESLPNVGSGTVNAARPRRNTTAQLAAVTGGAYQRRAERISLQLSLDSTMDSGSRDDGGKIMIKVFEDDKETDRDADDETGAAANVDEYDEVMYDENPVRHMSQCIMLPPVEVKSHKQMERLCAKQKDLVRYVEDMRYKIHGDLTPLMSNMIIF